MFSLPKKNIKILIIGLMLLPTINNCSSYLPSDKTVISKNTPTMALVAGVGLASWICVAEKNMNILENDKLTLGLSLLSVAGGCAAYKYLSSFTTENKLKKAENLINKNKSKTDKELWENVFEANKINNVELFKNINKKYSAQDYPNVAFFKSDFQKLFSNTQQAQKIAKSTIEYLGKTAKNNDPQMGKLLKLQSMIDQQLKDLAVISSEIKNSDNFEEHLKEFNKHYNKQKKHPVLEEQVKILKTQNSYFNTLFSNPIFMQNFLIVAVTFINNIMGKITELYQKTA